MDPQTLYEKLGGSSESEFPTLHSEVARTEGDTPYLRHPGVVLIAKPNVDIEGLRTFLEGYGEELNFDAYLDDPTPLPPGSLLLKTAGQTCYSSFGPKRTYNENAQRYFDNLSSSGHGSVFEHAVFSFFVYGVSRAITHEVVRHRAGTAFSQLSQRFVSGKVLRFVERPEYQDVPTLHKRFEQRIDFLAREYDEVAEELVELQLQGDPRLVAEARTDMRKRVQQSARSVLPNEAETTMVLSANVRAWRHMIEMRTDQHAEREIRDLYFRIFLCLRLLEPMLFGDYDIESFADGTYGATTDWRKI
jgi:thymidylate synthase (FAD)